MIGPIFVDTNVLLYAIDEADARKHAHARLWRTFLWKNRCGRLSFQVLLEFYANISRKWPDASAAARVEIRDLLAWKPTLIDGEVLELGWKIQDQYKISFWDSLIVAAAKSAGCKFLLTEDLNPGEDFDGVVAISPFRVTPDDIV